MSEIVGFDISYDAASNTVYINSGEEQAVIPTPTTTRLPAPGPAPTSNRTTPSGVLEKDLAIWLDEDYQPYENEYTAIQLINEEREKAGLNPLTINLDLCRIARIKATEMAEFNYLSHTSPNYGSPLTMMKAFGLNPNMGAAEQNYQRN